ncbi:hypothetical protein OIU85_007583 [Salix viminalis]|uniref:Uncharacterized protein n=1 Tax=Salix viminalis TaxID=40686 RepID=A0A9Q0SP28_SALVM|nr:hypothetical protein OIU85_007583 [Salix viminalis]
MGYHHQQVHSKFLEGQWERRLQTDINMARQALCEALSPGKPSSLLTGLKPACVNEKPAPAAPIYASSTENIARLLKGWMMNGPKQSLKNSTTSQNSFINMAGADLLSDFSQPMSPDTGLFQDESKPNSGGQVPLSLIERWLFDEGAMQGKDYLNDVTIDEDNLF